MRITEAAQRLGTSPRMLRYRDTLGLLPQVRETSLGRGRAGAPRNQGQGGAGAAQGQGGDAQFASRAVAPRDTGRGGTASASGRGGGGGGAPRGHRRFEDDDLAAVAHALGIEQRYDISPAALAFGLKVLTEPGIRAEVAELGRRIGRIPPPPARALDFEQERALRLLRLPPGGAPRARRN